MAIHIFQSILHIGTVLFIISESRGVLYKPVAYTISHVEAQNGSDGAGRCPANCIMGSICECSLNNDTTGVLIDGLIPNINTNTNLWASDLYTALTTMRTLTIGFRFQTPISLLVTEMNFFFCTDWNIPSVVPTISVRKVKSFENIIWGDIIGNVSLASHMPECNSLTKVYLNISMNTSLNEVFILFESQNILNGIYIGEISFSDGDIQVSRAISEVHTTTTTKNSSIYDTTRIASVVSTPSNTIYTSTTASHNGNISTIRNYFNTESTTTSRNESSTVTSMSKQVQIIFIIVPIVIVILIGVVIIVITTSFLLRKKIKYFKVHEHQLQNMYTSNQTTEIQEPNHDSFPHKGNYTFPKVESSKGNTHSFKKSERLKSRQYEELALESSVNANATYNSLGILDYESKDLAASNTEQSDTVLPDIKSDNHYQEVVQNDNPLNNGSSRVDDEALYTPIYDLAPSSENSIKHFNPENFKIIRTLGMGYFGKIMLAELITNSPQDVKLALEDQELSRKVAIKTLKKGCSSSVQLSFDKELKFMSRLQHENLVSVLGACTTNEPFIVMEYVENGDLKNFLENYDGILLNEETTTEFMINIHVLVNISAQIANGMKYLSSKNFIHRDLAARNILVGDNFSVKISDFGMSRNLYTSHYYIMHGKSPLPIRWMAKECFYGKFSTKSDVWAFGVTIWEIFTLCSSIPYEDMTDQEFMDDAIKKKRTLLEKPKDCPLEIYDVMLNCWNENAQHRSTFQSLHDNLSTFGSKCHQ